MTVNDMKGRQDEIERPERPEEGYLYDRFLAGRQDPDSLKWPSTLYGDEVPLDCAEEVLEEYPEWEHEDVGPAMPEFSEREMWEFPGDDFTMWTVTLFMALVAEERPTIEELLWSVAMLCGHSDYEPVLNALRFIRQNELR